MAVYPADSHIELRLLSRAGNLNFMNVMHFRIKSTPPADNTIREQIRTTYLDSYRLPSVNLVTFFAVQLRRLNVSNSEMVTETFTSRTGAVVSSTGVEFLASIIVLRPSDHSRRPGRIYSPCPPPGQYVMGVMDEQHRARLQTTCDGLNANFRQGGANAFLEQEIAFKVAPDVWGFAPVESFQFRTFYGTQTKRRARTLI